MNTTKMIMLLLFLVACGAGGEGASTAEERLDPKPRYTMLFDAKVAAGHPQTITFTPRHPDMAFTPRFLDMNAAFTVDSLLIAGQAYLPISGKGLHDLAAPLTGPGDTVSLRIVYDGSGFGGTIQASVIGFVP
jgi:hypothetical protein